MEDKVELLAPALHNASLTYVNFPRSQLNAHAKHREALAVVEKCMYNSQECEWPERTAEDLQFGQTLESYGRDYLMSPRRKLAHIDNAFSRQEEREEAFEGRVAEKMISQGWLLDPSEEWMAIKEAIDKEKAEAWLIAITKGQAKSLETSAEGNKGQILASETTFYGADDDSDSDSNDE